MEKKIIDVSSNQGDIDWEKVAATGVKEVIIRLSLGYGQIDKRAVSYALGANKAGLKVGYYHFAYPDTKTGGTVVRDAQNEAKYFTGLFADGNSEGLPIPHRIAVDLEKWTPSTDSPLKPLDYTLWVKTFLEQVKESSDMECMIYGSQNYLNTHLEKDPELGKVPLWIAYPQENSKPQLPHNWTEYKLWQYSWEGRIDGILVNVDLDTEPKF